MYDHNEDNYVSLSMMFLNTLSGLAPKLTIARENGKLNVTFSGNLLKQAKIHYDHGKIINLYITYKLKKRSNDSPDFSLENCLFGAIKITKDVKTSRYKYSGNKIRFDAGSSFSFGNNLNTKNVIIFGCDMSLSSHANNMANNVYVLGKDFIQGIQGTTLYAEKLYTTDFTQQDKRFVLSLHYNSDNSYLFVNGVQQLKFKSKVSYLDRNLLTIGNISAEFSTKNMEKTGLHGNIYDFSVDYRPIETSKIYDIHRYLMKKTPYCIKYLS